MSMLFGTLETESGSFTHVFGNLIDFIPSPDNVIPGGIDARDAWSWSEKTIHYSKAIRTFIVPHGIKRIPDGFMNRYAVTESVVFPDSLQSIGTEDGSIGSCGSFAGCSLPEIVLPESLKVLGNYAFGHCHIEKLVVNPANKSKYNRQFKDSTIKELYLPKSILETRQISIGSTDYGFYHNFFIHCDCTIIEY